MNQTEFNSSFVFIQHTSTIDAQVCVNNYNSDANNKDVITVDYIVTGGRQKDCILTSKNHSVYLIFSSLYPISPSDVDHYSNLCKSLQSDGSWQKCGNL